MQDIHLQAFGKKSAGKASPADKTSTKARDNRQRVKPKYINPNGKNGWSGRGRSPAWVLDICQKEGIDLAAFKKDSRFLKS